MSRAILFVSTVLLVGLASGDAWANRYYSPEMGRFISRDPIGIASGRNLYWYVWDRPTAYLDPMGLVSVSAPTTAEGAPWWYGPMPAPPNAAIPGEVRGATAYVLSITCCCTTCLSRCGPKMRIDPKTGLIAENYKSMKIECGVDLKLSITIKPGLEGEKLKGTYGHEQRHYQNHFNRLRNEVVPKLEEFEKSDACKLSPYHCQQRIKEAVTEGAKVWNRIALDETTHNENAGAPKAGSLMDPIGPMPPESEGDQPALPGPIDDTNPYCFTRSTASTGYQPVKKREAGK